MIVATRTLDLAGGEPGRTVVVRLFCPVLEENAWACAHEIGWPEGATIRQGWGADGVQALVIALQMIAAELYASDWHRRGLLTLDGADGGYGFPPPGSLRHMLAGTDRLDF